jgi:magnesium transporter
MRRGSLSTTRRNAPHRVSAAELEQLQRPRSATPPLTAAPESVSHQARRIASGQRTLPVLPAVGTFSGGSTTRDGPDTLAAGDWTPKLTSNTPLAGKRPERPGTLGKVLTSAAAFASNRLVNKIADAKFGPDLRLDEQTLRRNGLTFAAAVAHEYLEMVTSRRTSITRNVKEKMWRRDSLIQFLEFDTFGRSVLRAMSKEDLIDELRRPVYPAAEASSPRRRSKVLVEQETPLADALDLDIHPVNTGLTHRERDGIISKCEPVQLRDLRLVDPTFRSEQVLLVRDNAIILVLDDYLRAVIQSHRLLLFNHEAERVQRAIRIITERLQSASLDIYNAFEFIVLESMFIAAYFELEEFYFVIEQQIDRDLRDLNRTLSSSRIENMRLHMRHLTLFLSRIKRLSQLFDRVLGEDDDMSNMYLTDKYYHPETPRHPLDHEYVETLLESYYQLFQALSNRAELLDEKVNDSEATMDIKLDAVQNRMLAFNLLQHLCTAMFFAMNFIADIFGMNLNCPWYNITDSLAPWLGTVLGTTALATVFLGCFVIFLSRKGLLFGVLSWRKRPAPSWPVAKHPSNHS